MTASTYGRQVVLALTNKSGSGVVAGDVVVIDTTNNDAFTTSTAGAFTGMVGVAQDTIANNGTGRVLISGYAALVNVNASVTRGHFGKTFTVAKQATDAGASRVLGVFCQFGTGGATPDAVLFGMPDGSTGAAGTPGTPALTLGTTNATGAAVTLVATDATIAAFDATVPVTQAFGDSAAAGAATVAARRDHKHGMPFGPTISNNIIATDESLTGNNSWVDLATPGPAVTATVGASGIVKVSLAAHINNGGGGGYGDMGFAVSGANTISAGTANKAIRASLGAASGAAGFDNILGATFLLTGLAAGSTTFTAKYNQQGGSGTTHWTNREIIVEVY